MSKYKKQHYFLSNNMVTIHHTGRIYSPSPVVQKDYAPNAHNCNFPQVRQHKGTNVSLPEHFLDFDKILCPATSLFFRTNGISVSSSMEYLYYAM